MNRLTYDIGVGLGLACVSAGAFVTWGLGLGLIVTGGSALGMTVVGAYLAGRG